MTLPEVATKDKHISDLVHGCPIVGSPVTVEEVDVEVGYPGNFVSGQSDLLAPNLRDIEVGEGR